VYCRTRSKPPIVTHACADSHPAIPLSSAIQTRQPSISFDSKRRFPHRLPGFSVGARHVDNPPQEGCARSRHITIAQREPEKISNQLVRFSNFRVRIPPLFRRKHASYAIWLDCLYPDSYRRHSAAFTLPRRHFSRHVCPRRPSPRCACRENAQQPDHRHPRR